MRHVIVVLLTLLLALPAFAEERVKIRARPGVTLVGQLVNVTVVVPIHADNRKLVFRWGVEAEGIYQASEVQIDGDTKGTRSSYFFRREMIAAGKWKFEARIEQADGSVKVAAAYVTVRGGMDDPGDGDDFWPTPQP